MTMTNRAFGRQAKAILLASGASLLFAQAALAADDAAKKPDEAAVSEVVVTGTSLRGVAPVGSALTTVSSEDIKASGGVSTAEILNKTPQIFDVGVSESSRGQTGGSSNVTYGSAINIRGISPYETLTLVDGFRAVPQEGRAESVDPSHIPTNMLQRVEIVPDGGSAIYGSDAVAGVANLILKRRFEGFEVSERYGQSNRGFWQQVAQFTGGHVWSSGQFTGGFEYMHKSSIRQSKLPFDVRDQRPFGGTDLRSLNCSPGNIQIGTTTYAIPVGGVTPATANQLIAGTANRCDAYRFAAANPEQERMSLAYTFNQDITSWLHFDLDNYMSRRKFTLIHTPTAQSFVVPSTNAFFVAPAGVTPPLCSAATAALYGIPATSRCETVLYNNLADVGPDQAAYGSSQVFEVVGGFTIDLPREWQGAAHYTYGRNQDRYRDLSTERFNTVNQNKALASSDPTTAINPFGGATNPSVVSRTTPNGIYNQGFSPGGHTIMKVWDYKVDGPLFSLPGGEVRAALGYQDFTMLWWSNNTTGPNFAPINSGDQHVTRTHTSYYAEVNVPIIGEANAIPFIQALDINIAGRADQYNDVGNTKNPKYGINWTPVDGLKIHASYGTSFRSPNILDLYALSVNATVPQVFDPTCNCTVFALQLSGGNKNIKPETAKTYSLGFDFNPTFLPDFKASVNYFYLDLEGQISSYIADSAVLSKEALLAGTGVITRATLDQVNAVLAVRTVTGGSLPADHSLIKVILQGSPLNLGVTQAKGFDVTASYRIRTDNYGVGLVGLTGELFTTYKDKVVPNAAFVDRLNTIFYPPKWRARYYVGWNYGQWSGTLTANYLNSYTNTLVTPPIPNKIKANTTVDFHGAYDVKADNSFFNGLRLGVDITNLFDQDPPRVLGNGTGVLGTGGTSNFGGAGFDPTKSWIFGRLITFSIDKKF